jgi:D-glycero-D-manno-heptose 1,7-bisphosphate phosphatase
LYNTVILDRDGVINHVNPDYVRNHEQLFFIEGSIKAIKYLQRLKINVAVASNQAGIGKKLLTESNLWEINKKINSHLKENIIFYYCKHTKERQCDCRKPQPGLLFDIMDNYPPPYLFVGDNISDILAARAANIDAALVLTGYGSKYASEVTDDVPIFSDLNELVYKLFRSSHL